MFLSNENKILFEKFLENKSFISNMKNCSHGENDLNPYHLESDIWTHSMMVCSHLPDELFLAGLLHDIGKIDTREFNKEKNKVTFYKHEAYSFYRSIDILNRMGITNPQRTRILRLIANHSHYDREIFHDSQDRYDYVMMRKADINGRITTKEIKEGCFNSSFSTGKYSDSDYSVRISGKLPKVFMLIGCPSSGKTTFLKKMKDYYILDSISRDDIMCELTQKDNNNPELTYKECWDLHDSQKVEREYETRLKKLIDNKNWFVIDKTNMVKKQRKNLIDRLKKSGFNVVGIVMDHFGYTEILDLNSERKGKELERSVIDRMIKSFTYPTFEEGFDEIYTSTEYEEKITIRTVNDLEEILKKGRENILSKMSVPKELFELKPTGDILGY